MKVAGVHHTMRKITTSLAVALITLIGINNAQAHAVLMLTNPKANSVVKVLPEFIFAEFNENLMTIGDKNPNQITVLNSKNKRVDNGESLVGGARVSTRLKPGLVAGKYLVSYRIVSEDGHIVNGKFSFYYKPK